VTSKVGFDEENQTMQGLKQRKVIGQVEMIHTATLNNIYTLFKWCQLLDLNSMKTDEDLNHRVY
jgi:hypothetical protein